MLYRDRVKETTLTTGSGSYNLLGAEAGFQSFLNAIGSSGQCYYCAVNNTSYEIGIGTFIGSSTLTRDSILESSQSDNKVNWGAGSKTVFLTVPASWFSDMDSLNGPNLYKTGSGIFGKDVVVSGSLIVNREVNTGDFYCTDDASIDGSLDLNGTQSNSEFVIRRQRARFTDSSNTSRGAIEATSQGLFINSINDSNINVSGNAVFLQNIISNSSGIFGKTIVGSGGAIFYGTSYPNSFAGVYVGAYSFNAAVAGPMVVVSDYSASTTVGLGVRNDGSSYLGNSDGTAGVTFNNSDFIVTTKVSAPRVECLNVNAGFRFAGRDTANMGFEWFAPTSSVAKLYSYAVSNNVLEIGSNGNLLTTGGITASGYILASGSTCSVAWMAQNGAAGAAWYSPTAGNVRLHFGDVGNAPIQFGNNGDIFPTTNGGGSCGKTSNRFVMYGTNGDFSNNILIGSNLVANSSGIFGKDIVVSGELYLGDRTYPVLTNTGMGGYTSLRGSSNGGFLALQNGLNPLSWGNNAIHSNTKVYTWDLNSTYLTTYNLVTSNHVIASGNVTSVSGIFTRDVVASGDLKVYGSQVNFSGLPTTDPHDYGRLYRFGSGIFMSLG